MAQRSRLLLAVLLSLIGGLGIASVTACDAGDRAPSWVCQTEDAVASKFHQQRKCYRMAEYCEGGCEPQDAAQCFDIGAHIPGMGMPNLPDRMCYATSDDCAAARQRRLETHRAVHSQCRPASR